MLFTSCITYLYKPNIHYTYFFVTTVKIENEKKQGHIISGLVDLMTSMTCDD